MPDQDRKNFKGGSTATRGEQEGFNHEQRGWWMRDLMKLWGPKKCLYNNFGLIQKGFVGELAKESILKRERKRI